MVMSDGEVATARRLAIGILEPSQERVERLATWYSAEHDRLVRFAYLLTRDLDSAEDLVQDAFIRMYSVRDPIEETGYPAYARRVIVNLARSSFRRRSVERRAVGSLSPPEPVDRDHAGEMDIRRALLVLSVSDRACLALRYYEGQTDAEIATTLGISQAAAKKRVMRAHERLRRHLKEES
jgi:RNA polymerase sigma factor (sigma-70 family)